MYFDFSLQADVESFVRTLGRWAGILHTLASGFDVLHANVWVFLGVLASSQALSVKAVGCSLIIKDEVLPSILVV